MDMLLDGDCMIVMIFYVDLLGLRGISILSVSATLLKSGNRALSYWLASVHRQPNTCTVRSDSAQALI